MKQIQRERKGLRKKERDTHKDRETINIEPGNVYESYFERYNVDETQFS